MNNIIFAVLALVIWIAVGAVGFAGAYLLGWGIASFAIWSWMIPPLAKVLFVLRVGAIVGFIGWLMVTVFD